MYILNLVAQVSKKSQMQTCHRWFIQIDVLATALRHHHAPSCHFLYVLARLLAPLTQVNGPEPIRAGISPPEGSSPEPKASQVQIRSPPPQHMAPPLLKFSATVQF